MPHVDLKRGTFAKGGQPEKSALTMLETLPGQDEGGPTIGISARFAEGGHVVIQIPVDDAFEFAMLMLETVRRSERKYYEKFGFPET